MDAPGLEIGQVFGVVQVALRVQVPVADFDWVKEAEFRHGEDYTLKDLTWTLAFLRQSLVSKMRWEARKMRFPL